MATAYKCDRCNKYYDKFNKLLEYGNGGQYDKIELCKECSQAFENFIKEGMINEQ